MRQFEWNKEDGFETLAACTSKEYTGLLAARAAGLDENTFTYDDTYYFLINSQQQFYTQLPDLDYAFGFDRIPPYGRELEKQEMENLSSYRFIPYKKLVLPGRGIMLGAVIGELTGIRYKFQHLRKPINASEFIDEAARFGDETIMMTASAIGMMKGLQQAGPDWMDDPGSEDYISSNVRSMLRYYGDIYSAAGYDPDYIRWLYTYNARNINSASSFALILAIPAGWLARSFDEAGALARAAVAGINDNEEAADAAALTAQVLYLFKTTRSRQKVLDFARTRTDIPENAKEAAEYGDSAMDTASKCIYAVCSSANYSNALIRALELPGESDRTAAVTGGLAEAMYMIPLYLKKKASERISDLLAHGIYDTAEYCRSRQAGL